MALIAPYSLRADYAIDVPVSASDLNRRAFALSSQLPGALRAAALVPGVLPLYDPPQDATPTELLAGLASAADTALRVSVEGAFWSAQPGAALVVLQSESPSQNGALVYTQVESLRAPIQAVPTGETRYLHLQLAVPDTPGTTGEYDATLGDPPSLLFSELETEPNALVLASVNASGALTDLRHIAASVLGLQQLALVQSDLAYDASARAKGTVAARLATLEGTSGGSSAGVTYASQIKHNATTLTPEDAYVDDKFAGVDARLATIEVGANVFPAPFDLLADEIALNRVGLSEVNPHAVERGQISVVTKYAGHGQDDTPDFTPDTTSDLELPWDADTGLFGT